MRYYLSSVTSVIAKYDTKVHLSANELLILGWSSVMETYVRLHEKGIRMMAIDYPSWQLHPDQTAAAMLDYCNYRPDDMARILVVLERDSQAGSPLAGEAVKKPQKRIQPKDLDELNRHLRNHPFIKNADFKVPNTFKIN